MLDTLRIDRAVIVQPSVYGSDNRATLEAVAENRNAFRAVVVLEDDPGIRFRDDDHPDGSPG